MALRLDVEHSLIRSRGATSGQGAAK